MTWLLFLLFLLNISDAIGTWYGVTHGYAYEANPVMAALISHHGWAYFFMIKIAVVTLCVLLLHQGWVLSATRFRRIAVKVGVGVLLVFYASVNIAHVVLYLFFGG